MPSIPDARQPASRSSTSHRRLAKFARHPLTITMIGFILTGIGGTVFTEWLHDETSKRGLLAASQAHGIEAIHEIVDLINERRARAVMLRHAIRRNSPREAEARKAAYDEVYVRWNTKEQGIRLRLQEFIANLAPADYKTYIGGYFSALASSSSVTTADQVSAGGVGLLSQMDICVTDAYDDYRKTGFASKELADADLTTCRFDRLDVQLLKCSSAFADSLYAIIGNMGDRDAARRMIHGETGRIEGNCSLNSSPT